MSSNWTRDTDRRQLQPAEILQLDRRIALSLPKAFSPFFGRFGRLTDVQRQAIPSILGGNDVLICAATASGKTETACAPLVERNMARRRSWTVLYISPTRALVNDLYKRLESPLAALGLEVSRRTGDYRDAGARPHFLLTTPESFDSLLCRGADETFGHALAEVSAVVLDEVHLLYGSPRGEQVRWLLKRLGRLRDFAVREGWTKSSHFQVVALSATVPDPDKVRSAYLPAGEVIIVPGSREIEDLRARISFQPAEDAVPAYLQSLQKPEKLLVFANARKRVDALSSELKRVLAPAGYSVFGHHGSLAKPERELAEAAAKDRRAVVLVATSTLEIGIDIGDIDLVVLDSAPPDISSLLQRIGRGNRRTGKTRVLSCGSSPRDQLLQDALLQAARDSWLGPSENRPNNIVARQQIASYIFQSPTRRRSRAAVIEMAAGCTDRETVEAVVEKMLEARELEGQGGFLCLGTFWRDAGGTGDIHSTIEGTKGYSVVDDDTGAPVAHGIRYKGGKGLEIAGSSFEIKRVSDRVLEAKRGGDGSFAPAQWSYHSKKRCTEAGTTQAVRKYLGTSEDEWPVLSTDNSNFLFHFGGTRLSVLLQLLSQKATDDSVKRIDEWTIELGARQIGKPDWLTDSTSAVLSLWIRNDLDDLERALARPAANSFLPIDLRVSEIVEILDVEKRLGFLAGVRVRQASEAESAGLRSLLGVHS